MRIEDARPPGRDDREAGVVYVLQRLWTYSSTTKSDLAREFTDEIAEAASRGFITTSVSPKGSVYGRLWKLTPSGLQHLYDNAWALTQEDAAYVSTHHPAG